jgi:hypothetical protein
MTQTLRNLLISLVVGCPTAVFAADWTDDVFAPGRGAAQSFRPMQGPVAVRPLDNSTLNLDVAARLTDELRRRGIAVADDAPLVLEFDTQTETGSPQAKRGILELPPAADPRRERSGSADDSSDPDSTSRSRVRRPDLNVRYSLRATVSERQGQRLWEGYTDYGEIVRDENRLYSTMASLLASMVGANAEGRFNVD